MNRLLSALLAAPLLASGLLVAMPTAAAAADLSPQYVQRSARCPVCGMYPYRTPNWTGQIVFNDQTASSFDSPVDMFRFLNNMPLFDSQLRLTLQQYFSRNSSPRVHSIHQLWD